MKWHGLLGFVYTKETAPGVHDEIPVEKPYYGDVVRDTKKYNGGSEINDNFDISNSFSIVADSYLLDHAYALKYIQYLGMFWKIASIETQPPRLTLSVGGLYNGTTSRVSGKT